MGISGIGMSGIAKILIKQGYHVSGCDSFIDQNNAQELLNLGCSIAPHHQHEICNDPSITTLIHTSAIPKTHPEILFAQKRGIPIIVRATMLAEIMRTKFSIAIAGSHGKTTTSSLMSHILLQAELDPTVVVGGHIHQLKSNAHCGTGSYLVAESDESDRSFLLLPKTFSIVTNIDREHLETYKDLDDIKATFLQFMNNLPFYGINVLCLDDKGIQEIIPQLKTPYITYGTNSQSDWHIKNVTLKATESTFDVIDTRTNTEFNNLTISLPGMHNVLNATSVFALSLHIGIKPETIKNGLESFQGVDRRFTLKGKTKTHQASIFDDYGHHPKELQVTFDVAKAQAQGKLIVIFQPHRYSRTQHLWNDFVYTLGNAPIDELIITDIFPASEQPIDGITSEKLVQAIQAYNPTKSVHFVPLNDQGNAIITKIEQLLAKNDTVVFQGAGKVNKLAIKLLQ